MTMETSRSECDMETVDEIRLSEAEEIQESKITFDLESDGSRKKIGRGAFGAVFSGRCKLPSRDVNDGEVDIEEKVAIKEPWRYVQVAIYGALKKAELKKEINAFSQLSHDNIVRYFGYVKPTRGEHKGKLWLITQLIESDDLKNADLDTYMAELEKRLEETRLPETDKLREITQETRKEIARNVLFEKTIISLQIADAMAYLKRKTIYHRDLKPPNILIDKKDGIRALLCDFGLARNSYLRWHLGGDFL